MKLSDVLIKPILSEKANAQQDKLHRYAFRVSRRQTSWRSKKPLKSFME